MKDPAVLFYTGDFLNGCTGLTFEERGQYITLLCLQHQTGHLSEKTIRLSVGSVSVDVMKKFKTDENGLLFNERLDIEIAKRHSFVDSRRENGLKGGRPKKASGKPNDKPSDKPKKNLGEDRNRNENIIEFDVFWNLYNKKVGDRKKCEKKWNSLKLEIQQKIIETLPKFINQFSDKQYQPHPSTYLNQERWNDEIELKKTIELEPIKMFIDPTRKILGI